MSMKRTICLVVLVAFACTVATALWAQEGQKPKADQPAVKEREKPKAEGVREGEPKVLRVPESAGRMDKAVTFTDEQKGRIIELNKARDEAVKALNVKFQADVLALMSLDQKAKWEAAVKEGEKPKEGVRREGDKPKAEGERREGDKPKAEGERREGDKPKAEGERK
jgi:hypothetical protein